MVSIMIGLCRYLVFTRRHTLMMSDTPVPCEAAQRKDHHDASHVSGAPSLPSTADCVFVTSECGVLPGCAILPECKEHTECAVQSPPESTHEEYQYISLVREILTSGDRILDRTQVGIRALFGRTMRFSLRNNQFPLLTTKKVFFRGVVEELLWFISGSTNVADLEAKGVTIWSANVSKVSYMAQPFDAGPIYPFQWRHAGASYQGCQADYTGQGVDQLRNAIADIRMNPGSRRIVVCSWSPSDIPLMTLPPCHAIFQFHVTPPRIKGEKGGLSLCLYQRSGDMGLGIPFNIASYALLTIMVAHICELEPLEFIHMMGNVHLYEDHCEPIRAQLDRTPYTFPTLKIVGSVAEIDQFQPSHFLLENYRAHPAVALSMAV